MLKAIVVELYPVQTLGQFPLIELRKFIGCALTLVNYLGEIYFECLNGF